MVEEDWRSPGAPRRPGHHVLEDLKPPRNTWSPQDGVVLPQAGAEIRIQTLDRRMSQPVGSTLPHLLDQRIWKVQRGAVSHPQSRSTCMAVPNKNPVSPRLPVAPPRVCWSQQISCSHGSLASTSWFPQKREGKLLRSCLLPAPQLRMFWALPSLLSTPPPPHTLLEVPGTHTHTQHSPFSTLPTFPHKALPGLHQLPGSQGWKEPPGSSGSPLLTQNCHLDAFHKIPAKTSPSSCTPPRTGSSLPPKTGFSLDCSDFSISLIHGRGFCFSVVLSMSCHLFSLSVPKCEGHTWSAPPPHPEPLYPQAEEPQTTSSVLL